MCGICGVVTSKQISVETLRLMTESLAHRGPDDQGFELYHLSNGTSVGFGHCRLSIIDLSDQGHQPMNDNDGEISVVFNGEIYNYQELKAILSDYEYKSDSDTEVIIAAYKKWGKAFVNRINGMFAIALLDMRKKEVLLYRDRLGKKPLYYHMADDGSFIFGSELKAIIRNSSFSKRLNKSIVGRFLYRSYIAAPDTIFENTYKLEPGKVLSVSEKGIFSDTYWSIEEEYKAARDTIITDYEKAKKELERRITQSIKKRLVADVPVGAFLSGGYDSSLVCAIAQKELHDRLKTFSIGFYEPKFNEAEYAKSISKILGTDHTELYISEKDLLDLIDSISIYYDEPFADASEIPTMIVSKLARESVKVVLTGDGGDEVFGGYGIYNVLQEVQKRKLLGECLYLIGKIPPIRKTRLWNNRSIVYRILSDHHNKEARTQGGVNTYIDAINCILNKPADNYYYEFERKYEEKRLDITRMLLDMETSLPEDMLTKVDRASMRYGLECRCPFLDKDVVEYSFRLSPDFKNYNGGTKRILKDITHDYLPKEYMDRPKMGFSVPQDKWLRTVLKEQLIDWTGEDYLNKQDVFNPTNTRLLIEQYIEHGDGNKWSGQNYSRIVWAFFVFQQWYQKYMS